MAQKWEFGGQAGTSGYMGDLNPSNPVNFNDWMVGAFAKYNFNTTWGVRANIQRLNIYGDDKSSGNAWFRSRGLQFYSSLWELSAVAEFDFFKIIDCNRGKRYWQPYVFAGIGTTVYDPKVRSGNEVYHLRNYATEQDKPHYGNLSMVLPFGVGIKYKPKGSWVYGLEVGYRITNTDYLDDVSGYYPDIAPQDDVITAQLANPGDVATWLDRAGTRRGDGHPRDTYMQFNVRISYILFSGGCPIW
ncbi:Outer membrane protein beta-barrel domain-containing protein [bacterium A37T11]|nr:Outer membrane protein beta-barrel domain-containing protein [bacterium A37T11]